MKLFGGPAPTKPGVDHKAEKRRLKREYIWMGSLPVAVVENGVLYYERSDHIGRPVFATDGTGVKIWEVSYLRFGEMHSPLMCRNRPCWRLERRQLVLQTEGMQRSNKDRIKMPGTGYGRYPAGGARVRRDL